MSRELPVPKDIKDLFDDLLGRAVTVSPADPVRADDVKKTLICLYVDSGLKLGAVLGMEFKLAAYAGAAIGLIPLGGAEACIEDNELSKLISENVAEVFNVFGGLLNQEGVPHLKMYQMFKPGENPPNDAVGHLMALGRRLDLYVDVAGYGGGKLSVSYTD